MGLCFFILDIIYFFLSIFPYGNAGRSYNMVRQASSIGFIFLKIFFVLFNKAECKPGVGHYSSQRTLGSGSYGGHGIIGGNQLQNSMHYGNSLYPLDINSWYDYGT
jgi:hypothetical protein